jgi:hypothetical protein
MIIITTIEQLYDELSNEDSLKGKIRLIDDRIRIAFHDDFVMEIVLRIGFFVYINNIFNGGIDEQDILESIIEVAGDFYVIVERKRTGLIVNRNRLNFIPRSKFERKKDKWLNEKEIKIYSVAGMIKNNFNEQQ